AYPGSLLLRPGMAHYKFADVLEGKGNENVLDNSHAFGDLHRTRNQRLLAGRVLIPRNAVEASPSAHRPAGLACQSVSGPNILGSSGSPAPREGRGGLSTAGRGRGADDPPAPSPAGCEGLLHDNGRMGRPRRA